MRSATSLLCALSLTAIVHGHLNDLVKRTTFDFQSTCHQIAEAVSSASGVFFPSDPQYLSDISHAYLSSSEASACSVEPGSADDVGRILRILGTTRTPFGVKGGGHSANPGFSSTMGVEIAMTRFNDIKVDPVAATVEVGPGLTWDQVYGALDSYGVSVIGARVPGVGVAGIILGGGYSWLTNQHGLALDNVVGYELVLPNGTISAVTSNDSDLWFGLRGGLNNFGIVTKFILQSYPQGEVWGGFLICAPNQLDALKNALVRYQEQNDVKATASVTLSYSSGQITPIVVLFYDAPSPPQGIFDDFLAMKTTQKNVTSRSYSDLVLSLGFFNPPSNVTIRGYMSGIPVTQYSPALYDAFLNQTQLWGARLGRLDKTMALSSTLEPFDSGIFSHGSESASPPDRSHALLPSVILYSWSNASLDSTFAHALHEQSNALHSAALADGQNVSHAAVYVNNALFDTPLEDIYGANVPRLRQIRAEIDPEDVMGLAGGFKF